MSVATKAEAKVERQPWATFYQRLRRNVKAGEHGFIVGSTGSGKSVLAREVVPLFGRNIVVLDGKGGDDPSLRFPGFVKLNRWPPQLDHDFIRTLSGTREEPRRFIVTRKIVKPDDLGKMAVLFESVLRDLFPRKGKDVFALYVDEMQIIADPREGMGLGRYIGPLIRTKRYHGMSVITATQYPTWIPKSSYRETTHRFFFPIGDEESNDHLGKITGRRKTILPILDTLSRHEFLYMHAGPPPTFVITKVQR